MSIFSGIDAATVPGTRTYLAEGDYDLEIRTATVGTSRKGVPYVGVEFTVLGSNCTSHPVNSVCHYTETADKDGWLGRFRGFLHAVVLNDGQCSVAEITEQVAQALTADNGVRLRGYRVRCIVRDRVTQNGKKVSNHSWYPNGKAQTTAA